MQDCNAFLDQVLADWDCIKQGASHKHARQWR
jgi:hypothetical protein